MDLTRIGPVTVLGVAVVQSDGITCGPTVSVVAGALLDPAYADVLTGDGFRQRLVEEQRRVHAAVNRFWPRRLGTTPAGVAKAFSLHSGALGVRYGWRAFRGHRDRLTDVRAAVDSGWPVGLLVGRIVPRHWVLVVGHHDDVLRCYEPSSGQVREVGGDDVRHSRLRGLGFPRPYAFVLPVDPA